MELGEGRQDVVRSLIHAGTLTASCWLSLCAHMSRTVAVSSCISALYWAVLVLVLSYAYTLPVPSPTHILQYQGRYDEHWVDDCALFD